MKYLIIFLIISIILPIISKSNDSVVENSDKIVFEFNKKFKVIMFICTIISLLLLVACLSSIKEDESYLIVVFLLLVIFSMYFYLLSRNKKIMYINSNIYYYNVIGKKKIFNIKDIKEVVENPTDGLKLIFNNGQKIKIDIQMTNYIKIKEILDENNIIYKDKNGNNYPKGW